MRTRLIVCLLQVIDTRMFFFWEAKNLNTFQERLILTMDDRQ